MATTKGTATKTPAKRRGSPRAKTVQVIDAGPAGPQEPVPAEPVAMARLISDDLPADFVADDEEYADDAPDAVDDIVHPEDAEQFGMPPEHGTLVAAEAPVLTTTESFMGARPTTVREVADHGVKMVEGQRMYRVRVIIDVGPVYYGPDNLIELHKGKLYEVPESIYRYLREKDLLWEQQ